MSNQSVQDMLLDKVKENGVVDIIYRYSHELKYVGIMEELKKRTRDARLFYDSHYCKWYNNTKRIARQDLVRYNCNIVERYTSFSGFTYTTYLIISTNNEYSISSSSYTLDYADKKLLTNEYLLYKYKVTELKELCRIRQIKKYSKMRKHILIFSLMENWKRYGNSLFR